MVVRSTRLSTAYRQRGHPERIASFSSWILAVSSQKMKGNKKKKRHRMLKRTSDFSLLLDSSIHNHYRAYLTLHITVWFYFFSLCYRNVRDLLRVFTLSSMVSNRSYLAIFFFFAYNLLGCRKQKNCGIQSSKIIHSNLPTQALRN